MYSRDLPDISALALGLVRTYQANPSCQCYIYNMYMQCLLITLPINSAIIVNAIYVFKGQVYVCQTSYVLRINSSASYACHVN